VPRNDIVWSDYGHFSPEVFLLLHEPLSRALIKNGLLDAYFPLTKGSYLQSKQTGQGYVADLQQYILNEPEAQSFDRLRMTGSG